MEMWGIKVEDCDEYCQVYKKFFNDFNNGKPVETILAEY